MYRTDMSTFTPTARVILGMLALGARTGYDIKRAIDLSIDKYCSASAMVAKTATLTHDFEVVDTAAK